MNRKRKSADVLAQLGEPLPLPYRPTSQSVKAEAEDEENNTEIISETFKPRQVLLRHSWERDHDTSHTRLPVWQNRRVSSVESQIEETILDSIESKIASLRTEIDSGNDLSSENELLEQINQQLERIIELRHENTLMHELKRLQHTTEGSSDTRRSKLSTLLISIIVLIVGLGVVSFLTGSGSYDYCYYFC